MGTIPIAKCSKGLGQRNMENNLGETLMREKKKLEEIKNPTAEQKKALELIKQTEEKKLNINSDKDKIARLFYKNIELEPLTELPRVELIFEHQKKFTNDGVLFVIPIQKIYRVFLGKGNSPIFVKTLPHINLERIPEISLRKLDTDNSMPDEILEMLKSDKEGLELYEPIPSIKEEQLEKLLKFPDRKFNKMLDDFINEGSKAKDTILKKWAKTNSIVVSNNRKDYWLTAFRGHVVIIKPAGAGFSYLADKTGDNKSYASGVAGRGYKSAKTTEGRMSSLDTRFGGVSFDEFTKYHEPVPEMMLNFLAMGKSVTDVGSGTLTNKGCPKVSFIANAGKLIAKPSEMMSAFDVVVSKLSPSAPEAIAARFPLIFIKSAKDPRDADWLDRQEIELNSILVKALFEYAVEPINKIWKNKSVLKWLNKPDKDFKESIQKIYQQNKEEVFYEKARIFIENQHKCYAHLKGLGLEEACFDLLKHILSNRIMLTEKFIQYVLNVANERYEEWKSIVLKSIADMIEVAEQTPLKEIVWLKFANLNPDWLRALLLGYKFALLNGLAKKEEPTPISIILEAFENIPFDQKKSIVGEPYSFSSRVARRVPANKSHIEDKLYTLFGIETTTANKEWAWLTHSSDIDYLEFAPTDAVKTVNSVKSNDIT